MPTPRMPMVVASSESAKHFLAGIKLDAQPAYALGRLFADGAPAVLRSAAALVTPDAADLASAAGATSAP